MSLNIQLNEVERVEVYNVENGKDFLVTLATDEKNIEKLRGIPLHINVSRLK